MVICIGFFGFKLSALAIGFERNLFQFPTSTVGFTSRIDRQTQRFLQSLTGPTFVEKPFGHAVHLARGEIRWPCFDAS
jgi:hypothetical protein